MRSKDLAKAIGLDLRQPQGALAEGQCGLGRKDSNRTGLVEGHSRQAVVIPFYSSIEQVFAVFLFKRFPLMMHTLVLNVIPSLCRAKRR